LALLTIPSANVSFYGDYDGTTVTPVCNGAASTFNFTINFCASNATLAGAILHMLHLTDAQTVLGRPELLVLCCSFEFHSYEYLDALNGNCQLRNNLHGIDIDSYACGRRSVGLGRTVM
jgi:hypothetical protein